MQYAKFFLAVLATLAMAVSAALSDGQVTNVELVNIGIAVLNAFAVVVVPNLPSGIAAYSKTVVAFTMAVATALVGFLVAGALTPSEIVQLVVIGLAAIGIFAVPNQPAPNALRAR